MSYSRVSQTALKNLINQASTSTVPKQVPGLPTAMLPDLNTSVTPGSPNSLITGNTKSRPYSLTAVSSCPTDGTDNCIQLRLDAVGYAVNELFVTANASTKVTNQFRIGLYPFIQNLYAYFPLTNAINGSPTNSRTINYAAANLATLLDTNMNSSLGSGGTHIDTALTSVNGLISAAAPAPSATAARRPPRSLTSSSSPTAHRTTRRKAFPTAAGPAATRPPRLINRTP